MVAEVDKVTERATALVKDADALVIVSDEQYITAGEAWKKLSQVKAEIEETFDPIIQRAHTTHREALDKKAKFWKPVDAAMRRIKQLMSAYDDKKEQERKAEEQRLLTEVKKVEEDAKITEAVALDQAGLHQEAEAVLAEPIIAPPVIVQKQTPKIQGGPVYRTMWDCQVTDMRALVKAIAEGAVSINAVLPNATFLRQQAASLKEGFNIPGCKAFSRRV